MSELGRKLGASGWSEVEMAFFRAYSMAAAADWAGKNGTHALVEGV